MDLAQSVRIDKFLWAVRLCKSRRLATEACDAGKIQADGRAVKPSHSVKIGEIITAMTGEIQKTIKVVALLDKRVGAKLVGQFVEDLTPASEYNKPREKSFQPFAFRPKGSGRPTKKERRRIDEFLS
jgi:ribosome-associated heat shock protein Hsp15